VVVVQAGANIFLKDTLLGYTALHYAADCGWVRAIYYLLELVRDRYPDRVIDFVNEPNQDGFTAIHLAIKNGLVRNIRALLHAVADFQLVDLVFPSGSYLYYATHCNQANALGCLLEFPFSDDRLIDAMGYAMEPGRIECHKILAQEANRRGLVNNLRLIYCLGIHKGNIKQSSIVK
jgi:ankyrin repeat protein